MWYNFQNIRKNFEVRSQIICRESSQERGDVGALLYFRHCHKKVPFPKQNILQ